jgi:hypothetical protein
MGESFLPTFQEFKMRGFLQNPIRAAVLGCLLGAWSTDVPAVIASGRVVTPDLSHINDGTSWRLINANSDLSMQQGKSVVRLNAKGKPNTPSNVGLALVEGVDFAEGTLEIDLKGRGPLERCFLGVAFNVADGTNFEAVYFRPFNFREGDYSTPTHAVQYIAWPDHTWEKLRKNKPGQFESTVKPVPDPSGWFHARIEVTKQKVSVWVDDAKEPSLVVGRLSGRIRGGKIGLWVDSRAGSFRNLKIMPD